MMYAPIREELSVREYSPPAPTVGAADQWRLATSAARSFWEALAADARVSQSFRAVAGRNAAML
jgi:hypothetical protein